IETSDEAVLGIVRGIMHLGEQVGTAADFMYDAFNATFSGIEDLLTTFFTTGEFDLQKFGQTVHAEITRLVVRALLFKAIIAGLNFAGGISGSLGGPAFTGDSIMAMIGAGREGGYSENLPGRALVPLSAF